jgi:spore germination cell wall hydrolase CwlJ-like protein
LTLTVEIIKEIKVPTIIEKEVIVKVPITQIVTQTRVIYMPDKGKSEVDSKELECMTLNIYREANNQSVAGMIAVARVVMNRVENRRYPASPCKVIYEGPVRESWKTKKTPYLKKEERVFNPVRNRCQFSWYCDGKKDEVINTKDNVKWKVAQDIAFQVLAYDKWNGMVEGAIHYHATYVSPKWRHVLRLVGMIDDHIFYRQE